MTTRLLERVGLPRSSLRLRASLVTTVVIGAVLALTGALLVSILHQKLIAADDDVARARVGALLLLARSGDLPTTLTDLGDDSVAQVIADGVVVASSPNVAGRPPVADFAPPQGMAVRVVQAPDDAETETYRLWSARGTTPEGHVQIYLGSSVEAVSEASSALRRSVLIGVPVLTAALALLAWLVIGRVLRRLDRVRAEVDTITESRLGTRLPGAEAADEVGRLTRTMNAMLDRLETSSRQQRDLVADVSHDLQTPLAAQRSAIEVALRDPAGPDRDLLRHEVLSTTAHMERMVSDLLVLASVDAGVAARSPRPFDLDEVVLEEVARSRPTSPVRIDVQSVSAAPCLADVDDARRIVRNLLDNAVKHAHSWVQVATSVDGHQATCTVRDDGEGVAPQDRDRVFDRFHRGDDARSGPSTGLGLAVARSLAERNGGTVELRVSDAGAVFVARLPLLGVRT